MDKNTTMSKAKHARHAAKNKAAAPASEEKNTNKASSPKLEAEEPACTPSASPVQGTAQMPVQAPTQPTGYMSTQASVPANMSLVPAGGPVKPLDMGKKHGHGALKVFGITMAIILGVLALIYVAGALVFMGRFFPNTSMRDMDMSLKTPAEVDQVMQTTSSNYSLQLEGEGFSLKLSAADAGLAIDGEALARDVLANMNPWAWPYEIFQDHDETKAVAASYSTGELANVITAAVDEFNKTATSPENAYIAYDEQKAQFAIVPEKKGTALSADAMVTLASNALVNFETKATVTKDQQALPSIVSTDATLTQATSTANAMLLTNVVFTMAGTNAATLDASVINKWITFGSDMSVSLDEEALNEWVSDIADTYSTTGSERTYTRPDGKQITVSGGSYGWKVDEEALLEAVKSAVENDETGTAEMPCKYSATAFTTAGGQDWGARYVDVDLSEQHARMYNSSSELIWESDIVSGKPGSSGTGSITPTGVYYVNSKESPSVLKGRNDDGSEYESHVTYWMPFVGNSVGLHDASWQSSFGGTRYKDGAGSHGCVNLPTSKAADLYSIIELSDVVVVHW